MSDDKGLGSDEAFGSYSRPADANEPSFGCRKCESETGTATDNTQTCHIICRGFAALLVGIRATAPCSETKAEDLIATLEEFRQLNGAVAQAAIDHGLAVTTGSNQPSTAAYTLFVDAEQLDVALKRVRAVMD